MKINTLFVLVAFFCLSASQIHARIFRIGMYPNGSVNQCAACHINPSGGGARTPFGQDVNSIVKGSSSTPFWTAELAKKDSDGDGFTNGQEVGDPQGAGKAYTGAQVSNPGSSSSKPTLRSPQVSITHSNAETVFLPYTGAIQVAAKANAGDIIKVDLFDGTDLIGTLTAPPFDFALNLTTVGAHLLNAKATDYLGASAASEPLTIIVQPELHATPINISGIQSHGETLTLTWEGGAGPYLLQWTRQINATNWFNVLTTTNLSVSVAKPSQEGFYRISDKAVTEVVPFTVKLNGASEVPPITSGGSGFGIVSLDGLTLSYYIKFENLSSDATSAHIHGPADTSASAGVLVPLNGASSTNGILIGSLQLTQDQTTIVKSGQSYVNIHTSNNRGGEIRGQILLKN